MNDYLTINEKQSTQLLTYIQLWRQKNEKQKTINMKWPNLAINKRVKDQNKCMSEKWKWRDI